MRRAPDRLLLAGILAVALGLRLWALDFGLPNHLARPDEYSVLYATHTFPQGDMNPHWFIYPSLYFYLVWLWEEVLLLVRPLGSAGAGYLDAFRHHLPDLIWRGRLLSALAGTATVLVVARVGRQLGGRCLGLAAAALLAVDFLHERDSHALKPDVLLALAMLVGWQVVAWLHERPTAWRGTVTGLAIGAAMGIKYPAVVLLVPCYAAAVLGSRCGGLRRWMPRAAIIATVAAGAFFLGTSPYLLIARKESGTQLASGLFAVFATHPQLGSASTSPGPLATLWAIASSSSLPYHLGFSLRYGCGLPMAVLALPAIGLWLRPAQPARFLLALLAAAYLLTISLSPVRMARYVTPLVPLLCLVEADLVLSVARVATASPRRILAGALLAALGLPGAASAVGHNRIIARTDTRVLASRWLARHVRRGARVGVVGTVTWHYGVPIMPRGIHPVTIGPQDPEVPHRLDYVLTHDHPLGFSTVAPALFARLAPHLSLRAEFNPFRTGRPSGIYEAGDAYYVPFHDFSGVERPGPLIRIYAYHDR